MVRSIIVLLQYLPAAASITDTMSRIPGKPEYTALVCKQLQRDAGMSCRHVRDLW